MYPILCVILSLSPVLFTLPSTGEEIDLLSLSHRKCCPSEEFLYQKYDDSYNCVSFDETTARRMQESNWSKAFEDVNVSNSYPCMGQRHMIGVWDAEDYSSLNNETFYNKWNAIHHNIVCADYYNHDGGLTNASEELMMRNYIGVMLCSNEDQSTAVTQTWKTLSTCGLGVSIIFLIIILFLSLSTPGLRQKVKHKCSLSYVACLIMAFGALIWIEEMVPTDTFCAFGAYMTQYWFLSAFFWRTITCFNMWSSVKGLHWEVYSASRIMTYFLYAWGCPLIISFATMAASQILNDDNPYNPGFGEESCWFNTTNEKVLLRPIFIYFYSFMSLSLLINLSLFIDTIRMIRTNDKHWEQRIYRGSERHEKHKARFAQFWKLFLIMGLTWLIELASFFFGNDKSWVWIFLDLGSSLHGIIIFLIFSCNSRVRRLLKQKFFPRRTFLKEYRKCMIIMQQSDGILMKERQSFDWLTMTHESSTPPPSSNQKRRATNLNFPSYRLKPLDQWGEEDTDTEALLSS